MILLAQVYAPRPRDFDLVAVTGRVTCGGHPIGGVSVIFQATDPHGYMATCPVMEDGTFRMEPRNHRGLIPGTYRACVVPDRPDAPEAAVALEYQDPRTSGLLVRVGPDWNDIAFTLPGPGRVATLARHR
jgi:hypothetical protein